MAQTNKVVAYIHVFFSEKWFFFYIIIRRLVNFKLCQMAAIIKLGKISVKYDVLKGRSNAKWV